MESLETPEGRLSAGPVRLRRFRRGDLAAFQAYRRDPEVGRYQSWSQMTDEAALRFIDAVAAGPAAPPGEWSQIAIAAAADDGLVGDIGVFLAADESEAEIGFTIAPAAQGKGWGGAAAARIIDYLFETTPARRVIGIADKLNAPSLRLMTRIGMIAIAEEEAMFRGAPCVEVTYEMRRS